MRQTEPSAWRVAAINVLMAGALAWPATAGAQTVVGNASAARATSLSPYGGTTTALADTGSLGGTRDAREASSVTGNIPGVLAGETLRTVTIGWPDQVTSEASLSALGVTLGGARISADFAMASARAVWGAAGSGSSLISNLTVNGVPVAVTGEPNQKIAIPGGRLVVNEQTVSSAGATVNALHAVVYGVADVVIASATAGLQ